MDLDIGQTVKSKDGQDVGKVDRIIVDSETLEVQEIVIHQGFILTTDRLADRDSIERIDDDGTVHLAMTADEADQLPVFVKDRYYAPSSESFYTQAPSTWGAGGSSRFAPVLMGPVSPDMPASGATNPVPGQSAFAEAEQFDAKRSVDQDTVVLSEGTDVFDSDGEHLGRVDEIVYTEDGIMTAFIISAGFIFQHDARIPMDWVKTLTNERVELRVSSADVEGSEARSD